MYSRWHLLAATEWCRATAMHWLLCSCPTHTLVFITMPLFLKHKKIKNALRTLQLVHDAQPGLVRQSICLSDPLHPRITAVSHGHKIADVSNVREVVGDVADSVHDALLLVVDANDGGLERRSFGALHHIGACLLVVVVHEGDLAFLGQPVARRDVLGHAARVSTVACLLEKIKPKTSFLKLDFRANPPPFSKK